MRYPENRLAVWVVLTCALCLAQPSFTQEETEEVALSAIPWQDMRDWADGVAEKGKEEAPAEAKKKSDEPSIPDPEWKPARPGQRRPLPAQAAEITKRMEMRYRERILAERKRKDWKDAWDSAYKARKFDEALTYLFEMVKLTDKDRAFRGERNDGWMYQRFWETSLMMKIRRPQAEIDSMFEHFKAQRERVVKNIENDPEKTEHHKKNVRNDFNDRIEFYEQDAKDLLDKLAALDEAGDTQAEKLWELCQRYHKQRPEDYPTEVANLYKMREWYPSHKSVRDATVQWWLCNRLLWELNLPDLAVAEADYFLEKYLEDGKVKRGDLTWFYYETFNRWGDNEADKPRKIEKWREAIKYLEKYRVDHPDHWRNKATENGIDTVNRINRLHEKIRETGG